MGRLDNLRLRQLDSTLGPLRQGWAHRAPSTGWVKTIREALGMSIRQLAERTGMSKTSVASAERSEARGSVQMDTLQRLAEGLDCDVVYALVPRTSLEDTLKRQATRKAQRLVGRVSDSMELEAQGISSEDQQRQRDDLVQELLSNRGQDFWDV